MKQENEFKEIIRETKVNDREKDQDDHERNIRLNKVREK